MLTIERLCKAYGSKPVLQNLSLALEPGEIYGLLGPNGAGKTTTINIICGLLKADAGAVYLGGQPVTPRTKRQIGIVPQSNLLYTSLSCRDNLAFLGRLYGLSRQECQRRIEVCLGSVNLLEKRDTPVERLSGGMQRRLSLAAAMLHKPQLVILDEPTTGLDIEARQDVWQLIRQLKDMGVTVLLTSHLFDEVERLCQRIGILRQGSIVAEGTLEALRQQIPAHEIVTLDTPDPESAIRRGQELGYAHRYYGGELAFWVPDQPDLKELIARFDGVPMDSIARHPIRLEHVYLEVTRPTADLPSAAPVS
ncbi:ABC transporter ATP-binding protein [Leptolyngbya sp. BL0902]|uniref:ABC transporter ATP-binding protein n=1 Tax=Leptolyngbya sp. BL0902 TaxID=1115757 RepID=UPI0018E8FB5B|nr:ABC transporter ATP-binding protein [Leptolyngbya sp. BL0902]QQE66104.1 ABC transporter ATP-binding protein [Leptolyngbya sp. BL0902]